MDLGLTRLRAALAELGHPERRFGAVQVAGTNGKGSICTLLEAVLRSAGLRCGLYTSPHLVSWCERIRLDGLPIPTAELRQRLGSLQPLARRHDLTPFELVTAVAFEAFAEAGLPLVVLEVGLGGRLDATTVHPDRQVVGFGTIGFDHAEFLGPTLAAIASEKAGVLTPGSPAVSGPQPPEVEAVLRERARVCGAPFTWMEPLERRGDALVAGSLRLRCGLPGEVQRHNGAVALGMLMALRRRGWEIPDAAIVGGFAAARWPGRLQPVRWRGRPLLIDGAHNLPAARALRAELDRRDQAAGGARPRHWVLGILASKQGPEILEALLAQEDRAWLVPVPDHACWRREELTAALPWCASRLETRADPEAALAAATADPARPVVVAGSLYLLGALLAGDILQDDPAEGE